VRARRIGKKEIIMGGSIIMLGIDFIDLWIGDAYDAMQM